MATLMLSTVGTMLGGPVGGMLGTMVGQTIDRQILGGGARKGPRLGDLSVQTSSYGSMIPRIYGRMRVAGTVVWATELREESDLQGDGKSQPETVVYSYSASFAVTLSSRRAGRIGRIWADGKLLRGAAGDFKVPVTFRFHEGGEEQAVDPLIASVEGIGRTPAYRGLALAVFEDLGLAEFGNRIPSITFEVIADEVAVAIGTLLSDASEGAIEAGDVLPVAGYVAHGSDVAVALAPLIDSLAIELTDRDGALRSPVGDVVPVAGRDLGAGDEAVPRLERAQQAAAGLPAELTVTYYDPERDYQAGQARAAVPGAGRRSETIALPMVCGAGEAKAIAEGQLARAWRTRERMTLRLPMRFAGLAPGQRVMVEGLGGAWVAERVAIERFVVVATVRPDWTSAALFAADPGRGLPAPDVVAQPTALALFDLPEPETGQPVLHVAAASPSGSWRPVPLTVSIGGVVSSTQSAAGEAALGTAVTALAEGQAYVLDLRNSVEVRLANPNHWLQSRDDAALAAGSNLAVVGDELVQFGRAEPLGEGRFRLSRLLRARRGTEWAMAGHAAGERFAPVDARAFKAIALPVEAIGTEVAVTAHGVGDGDNPVPVVRAANGEAMRPLSVAGLRAGRLAGGGLRARWLRRSRAGFAWLDQVDTGPDPNVTGCRVRVTGAVIIERELAVDELLLSAAEAEALGAGPISITVWQVGAVGLSRPVSLIV